MLTFESIRSRYKRLVGLPLEEMVAVAETAARFGILVLLYLTILYIIAWQSEAPPPVVVRAWTGVVLAAAPILSVVQLACFFIVPAKRFSAAFDVLSLCALYIISLVLFSSLYYALPRHFTVPSTLEADDIKNRLSAIEQEIISPRYRAAEAENQKRLALDSIVFEETAAYMKKAYEAKGSMPGSTGVTYRVVERNGRIELQPEQQEEGPSRGLYGPSWESALKYFADKHATEYRALDEKLLGWRDALLRERETLKSKAEQHSYLAVLYAVVKSTPEIAPKTSMGRLIEIGRQLWSFLLLTVFLVALRSRPASSRPNVG